MLQSILETIPGAGGNLTFTPNGFYSSASGFPSRGPLVHSMALTPHCSLSPNVPLSPVLSDIQHELLAWSMEKRILPQQQELVRNQPPGASVLRRG